LKAGRDINELAIIGTRPSDCRNFAFVGVAPKRKGGRRYRCSFCETSEKFDAGRVVLSDDGLRLIGDTCWKTHLDEDRYEAERKDWTAHENRRRFAERRHLIASKVSSAIPAVRPLSTYYGAALAYIEELPRLLASDQTGFAALLHRSRPDNGRLYVDDRKPDPTMGNDARGRPLRFIEDRKSVHQIQGLAAAFDPVISLRAIARDTLERLHRTANAIVMVPDNGDNADAARQIAGIQQRVSRVANDLRRLKEAIRTAQRFLSVQNFQGLSDWANHNCCDDDLAGRIRIEGAALIVVGTSKPLILSPPPELADVAVPMLDIEWG
jgi:hypothetical protein